MKTREEILADLRVTVVDLDCSVDEARAVIALENVYRVEEQIHQLRDDIDQKAELFKEVLTAMITSRHSGEKQADVELEKRLRALGVLKTGGTGKT